MITIRISKLPIDKAMKALVHHPAKDQAALIVKDHIAKKAASARTTRLKALHVPFRGTWLRSLERYWEF